MKDSVISPITIHAKKRAYERFGYNFNRKVRMELVRIIENNFRKYIVENQGSGRHLLRVPVFLSREMMNLNPDIKFGDWVIIVYDKKVHRIITMWGES